MTDLARARRPPAPRRLARGGGVGRRGLWLAVALAALGLYLLGAPERYGALSDYADTLRFPLRDLGLTPFIYAGYVTALDLLILLAHGGIALLLLWRRPTEPMALLVALALVTVPLTVTHALQPSGEGARLLAAALQALALTASVALPYLFPDGRFVPGWSRALVAAWSLLVIWGLLLPASPLAPARWPDAALATLLAGVVGGGIGAQLYRYRRTEEAARREQLRWAALGLVAAALAPVGFFFPIVTLPSLELTPLPTLLYQLAGPELFAYALMARLIGFTLFSALLLLFPLCFLIAIRRYRLWEIDRLLHRTLLYGALTTSVILLYVLVVGVLAWLLQTRVNLVVAALATGAIALAIHPLRQRLQRAVNRLLYGLRDDPVTVLSRLVPADDAAIGPEGSLRTIVETVAQALRLPQVTIAVEGRGEAGPLRVASGGSATGPVERFAVVHQGEWIGEMLVAPRSAEEPLSEGDRRLLAQVAHQAGAVAHAARLQRALRHSREALVTAREEERRRLRRQLHDDLGPRIAALTLRADAARNLLDEDPEGAARLLGEIKVQARDALAHVRRLAYDLRPPALDQLGLLAALRERAAAHSTADLVIHVEAPARLPSLPAAVEVAAYLIVIEAITNVERHADASRATIRITVGGPLEIEVRDDGVGLPTPHRAGIGLATMRERAEELGGRFTFRDAPGRGTAIHVTLPLEASGDKEPS